LRSKAGALPLSTSSSSLSTPSSPMIIPPIHIFLKMFFFLSSNFARAKQRKNFADDNIVKIIKKMISRYAAVT